MFSAAIFKMDMLVDKPFVANWNKIGKHRQDQIQYNVKHETVQTVPHILLSGQSTGSR